MKLAAGRRRFLQVFMRKGILPCVLITLSVSHVFGASFEGVVHFKSTYWGEESEFDYYRKGNRTRMETNRSRHGRAAVIMDLDARKVSMLLLNWRLAMVMNMEEAALLASNRPTGSLVKTGKTRIILGHHSDQFIHIGKEEETEIWGTTGLGVFIGLHTRASGFGRAGDSPEWARALRDQGIFPLIVIRKHSGEEQARMEATRIEKKALPEELFAVPRRYLTYDKFDPNNKMPGMPGTVWVK
jgi:hypothetical protein